MKYQKIETKGREPRDILNDLVNAAHSTLSQCLSELLVQAKDWGFRNDPQARDLYVRYDALDAYAAFHEVITATCLEEAKAGFFTSPDTGKAQTTPELDDDWELQVIEPEEIELAGASESLAKALNQRFSKPLLYIELRLDYLNHSLDEPVNPKGWHPQSLMLAFQHGINRLAIKLAGKVLLCEFFQQQLYAYLERFYSQVNHILNDCGILNNEKWLENAIFIRNLEAQTPAVLNLSDLVEPALAASDQIDSEARKVAVENAFDSFLPDDDVIPGSVVVDSGSIDDYFTHLLFEPVAPGTGSMLSSYQRAQIVGALSWVQRERAMSDVPLEHEEIKVLITRKLYDSGIFNAGELVARETPAMDFVNQIFLTVGRDDSLSEPVKSLVCKLQIPTIKLALLDFEFFKNPRHPARETLNHLTEIAVGIMDDRDPLLTQLTAIVKQILEQFDTEVSVFQNALNKLEKLALSESERIRKNETSARRRMCHDVSNLTTQSTVVASDEGLNAQLNLNDLPASVKPGTWFEVYQAEGRARRHLKLSAILKDSGEILFANRLGEKELLIDIETFLEDLRKGYSKKIQDSNLFDRALSSVINDIRKSQQERLQRDG